eukprot:CAMPEP_0119376444 /NCGR_PEP_ID=MMETSP1334-20130426/40082_1 /TAXON_ID=127549 /ORGANISM="Calcidiscus leptoporus, Strain RCC1130" /LENGTH=88 /DNA_ID=CAMNT_0007395005 /DNA_START=542 /DNA_END=804 /DNA_ORIENTATION=+
MLSQRCFHSDAFTAGILEESRRAAIKRRGLIAASASRSRVTGRGKARGRAKRGTAESRAGSRAAAIGRCAQQDRQAAAGGAAARIHMP